MIGCNAILSIENSQVEGKFAITLLSSPIMIKYLAKPIVGKYSIYVIKVKQLNITLGF